MMDIRSRFVAPVRQYAMRTITFVFCSILMINVVSPVFAEEGADTANNLLDNLKRRSAEERWQRIKRLYPSDSSAVRYNTPARLPENPLSGTADEQVPPSPEQTSLIPRLTALPVNTSNDWILPARPSALDDGSIVPSPDVYFTNEAASSDVRPVRPATRVASQDVNPSTENEQKPLAPITRNVLARKITDINPYYERDRDTDIRDFANEKIKEYEGQFHPRTFEQRSFPQIAMNWEAPNQYYYPLYFSDPALERTGHSYHPIVQPFASIARFGVQFVMLPYQMTIEPICTHVYPLGWYRPGECAPMLHYQIPLNAQAAVVEAATVTGLFFVIP